MKRRTTKFVALLAVVLSAIVTLSAAESNDSRSSKSISEPNQPQPEDILEGRDVVVRLYDYWRFNPYGLKQAKMMLEQLEEFKKITISLKKRLLIFDPNDPTIRGLGKSAAVVILPDDQTDALIKQSLGNKIGVCPFQWRLGLPPYIPPSQPTAWWTFKDALGNPIPRAVVTIFLSDSENLTKVKIKTVTLDDAGLLNASGIQEEPAQLFLIISHPDYGIAALGADQPDSSPSQPTIPQYMRSRDKTFRVPLVKAGTKPDERSIWGVVLNDKGRPVPAAVIHFSYVQTLGGGIIRESPFMSFFTVIADQSGRFAMHLPTAASTTEQTSIPPNAKYKVTVEAPKALQMLPWSGLLPVGQETTITLERGSYFRTFTFEDANGPITDPDVLGEIFIQTDRSAWTGLSLSYADWKSGKWLPLGTYSAGPGIHHEQDPEFEPVEVTVDSPQQIVFKTKTPPPKTDILYTGQVVHGITGQPMPGVFIIAVGFYEANFSTITPEQWQQLNRLEVSPSLDDSALEPVHKIIPFNRIVRTSPNGQFEIDINPTDSCEFLMAFYENYLAVRYRRDEYSLSKSDPNSPIELPTILLYPAAKVIIEPNLEEKDCSINLRWEISRKNQPDWSKEFFAFGNKSWYPFTFKTELFPNVVESVPIPAGLTLQFELIVMPRVSRGMWCPIYTEPINAAQGQIIDLGRFTIQNEIPIYVKAIDSAGNPIEGLAITHGTADGERWFGQSHITDSKGVTSFFAPPVYKAAFFVGWHGSGTPTPWQKLTYETKGPQDANTIFTMQLSDDMLEHLFK